MTLALLLSLQELLVDTRTATSICKALMFRRRSDEDDDSGSESESEDEESSEEEEEEEEEGPTPEEQAAAQALALKTMGKQIYEGQCMGCHMAPAVTTLNARDPAMLAAASALVPHMAIAANFPNADMGEAIIAFLVDPS